MPEPSSSFHFRLAELHESGTVQAISSRAYIAAYRSLFDGIPGPATEDYTVRVQCGNVYVALLSDHDKDICGVLVLEPVPSLGYIEIFSIAVDPRYQGRGLGRSLLAFAEEHAARMGLYKEIRLYTNSRMKSNIDLYQSCGFKVIASRQHPVREGEILLDMVKEIGSRQ